MANDKPPSDSPPGTPPKSDRRLPPIHSGEQPNPSLRHRGYGLFAPAQEGPASLALSASALQAGTASLQAQSGALGLQGGVVELKVLSRISNPGERDAVLLELGAIRSQLDQLRQEFGKFSDEVRRERERRGIGDNYPPVSIEDAPLTDRMIGHGIIATERLQKYLTSDGLDPEDVGLCISALEVLREQATRFLTWCTNQLPVAVYKYAVGEILQALIKNLSTLLS